MTKTIPIDISDFLSDLDRRVRAQERRAQPMSARDLLGAGAGSRAIRIEDWNAAVATYNGNYYTEPGALHSPDPVLRWTGAVIAKDNGSGMQEVWNTDDLENVQYWMRTYVPDITGMGSTFSDWRQFSTPTGMIEYEHISTETIEQLMAEAEAIIAPTFPVLVVYQQDDEPTDPEDGRPLQVGDQWIDTTGSENIPHIWDGTTWVNYAAYVLGDLPAEFSDLVLDVEGISDKFPITTVDITDDAVTAPKLQANAVTAKNVQTDAAAGVGIKMVPTGLVAYGITVGVPTVIIDATNGNLTIDGTAAAANITGANIYTSTGGTIATDAAAVTGIKMTTSGLVGYGGGVAKFTLDATTGNVVLEGTMSGAGTILGPTLIAGASASSGERVVIRQDGSGGIIEFYAGISSEVAGYINPSTSESFGSQISIAPSSSPTFNRIPLLQVASADGGTGPFPSGASEFGGWAGMYADQIRIIAGLSDTIGNYGSIEIQAGSQIIIRSGDEDYIGGSVWIDCDSVDIGQYQGQVETSGPLKRFGDPFFFGSFQAGGTVGSLSNWLYPEITDTHAAYSAATGIFTVPSSTNGIYAGLYHIIVAHKANGSGTTVGTSIVIRKVTGGVATNIYQSGNVRSGGFEGERHEIYYQLAEGDQISVRGSGGSFTMQSDSPAHNNFLQIRKVS